MEKELYLIKQRAIEIMGKLFIGAECSDDVWHAACALARAQLKEEGRI